MYWGPGNWLDIVGASISLVGPRGAGFDETKFILSGPTNKKYQ